MNNSNPKVSIVMPAFNEEKYIENSLFSLLESEQRTEISYEVILVDNNSSDQTVKLAQKFAKGMNLRIFKEDRQGRGIARARGFDEARGEIILSADADTIFYQGWVETLVSALKDGVVATTTPCKITDCSSLTNALFNFTQPRIASFYRLFSGHYWLAGFSFGILKTIYQRSGGFNTSLQAQEDIDLSFRVAKLGKIKFINKPVIFSGRRFKKGLWIGLYEYIQTFVEAFVFRKEKNVYLDNPR
ncbi:MAG: glycosyltransferase [Candidatus Daviesbacteria bacterium]|nr:glycosyltransferase [Candidatus Daviesbacteria bacterium]